MNSSEYNLPELMMQSSYPSWSVYLDKVYEAFVHDFIKFPAKFRGTKLALKKYPLIDGKEYTFYHFTHEGEIETNRLPDLKRIERIKWPKQVIENCDSWKIKVWPQKRNGKDRICIWLELTNEPDYIVILDIRKNYVLPWTAFVIEYENERAKKQKEYDAYIKAKTAQQS
jgi:hypothetical protein